MLRAVYPSLISEIDKACAENGIETSLLIKRSGKALFNGIRKLFSNYAELKFLIICGTGNNGKDGIALSKILISKGISVDVFFYEGDKTSLEYLNKKLDCSDCVVDCLLGTGYRPGIPEQLKKVFDIINSSNLHVVSCDIPSGVDGETGCIEDTAVKAYATITLCRPKPGLFLYPGRSLCGKIITDDLEIPDEIVNGVVKNNFVSYVEKSDIVKLPSRKPDSHKGDYGRVGVIAGSKGMTGAGILSANAAMRAGAGVVHLIVPEELMYIYEITAVEAVKFPRSDINSVLEYSDKFDSVILGPGLGRDPEIRDFVQEFLIKSKIARLIIDADAINALSGNPEILKKVGAEKIITPHDVELSRLTGASVDEIKGDRLAFALHTAKLTNSVVVMKGAATVVASPDGRLSVNGSGNPALATAGSGDVLSGIIGTFSVSMDLYKAAVTGVFIHGKCGDLAASELGESSVIASDLIQYLPKVLTGTQ